MKKLHEPDELQILNRSPLVDIIESSKLYVTVPHSVDPPLKPVDRYPAVVTTRFTNGAGVIIGSGAGKAMAEASGLMAMSTST